MSATETTPDAAATPPLPNQCPKCGATGKATPGTYPVIYHCDTDGATWGGAEPQQCAHGKTAAEPCGDCLADEGLDDAPRVQTAESGDSATGSEGPVRVQVTEVHAPGDKPVPGAVSIERPDFDSAVEQLGTLPAIPDRASWMDLAMHARMLSMSPLAPKILRGNPWACMDLAMTGRALGIDVFTAADLIDIIPDAGENYDNPQHGRKAPSPELINARIQQLGLGSIRPLYRGTDKCVAVALLPGGSLYELCMRLGRHFIGSDRDYADLGFVTRPDEPLPMCQCKGVLGHSEFTWEMARIAGLVQSAGGQGDRTHDGCAPGDHHAYAHPGKNNTTYTKCDCRTGYITYPDRMLWWRACGFCADDYFPAAGLGLYSAEALGAAVDEEGRMINPATVALPDGFEPEVDPATLPADPHLVAHLMARMAELPDAARAQLRARWAEKQQEKRLPSLNHLRAGDVQMATALVNGAVTDGRKEGARDWRPTVPTDPAEWTCGAEGCTWCPAPAPGQTAATPPAEAAAPDSASEAEPPPQAPTGAPTGAHGEAARQHMAAGQAGAPTEPSEQALTLAIAQVQPMTARELNGKLRERDMSTEGDPDNRRRRLGYAIAMELTMAEWFDQQQATEQEAGQ
jgi:hypothetical protein